MTHSNRAFTLIEILIALVIFAIIGVIVSIGLRNIIQTAHLSGFSKPLLQTRPVTLSLHLL